MAATRCTAATVEGGGRLHVDAIAQPAANWITLEGWLAGLPHGEWSVEGCPLASITIHERPDVSAALHLPAELAHGLRLQILDPRPLSDQSMDLRLLLDGKSVASLSLRIVGTTSPVLPFASRAAKELTQRMFLPPDNGGTDSGYRVAEDGTIRQTNCLNTFDNTRIGNYHPDIETILADPNATGLDIGCGLRDRLYDNMVTQDVYPTPAATLVMHPETLRLPFPDASFDLVVLDSVLEHVPNPRRLLEELWRVLKPEGRVHGDAPLLQPIHLAPHHYFNFTPHGIGQIATDSGYRLDYVAAESHQRPEFSLEWLLRRTFETIPPAEADRLQAMPLGEFYRQIAENKTLIPYPPEALTEMAAGFRFHLVKPGA